MKDWKAIAQARGVSIPAPEIQRTLAPLDTLEEAFRPLVKHLTPDQEPLPTVQAAEDSE